MADLIQFPRGFGQQDIVASSPQLNAEPLCSSQLLLLYLFVVMTCFGVAVQPSNEVLYSIKAHFGIILFILLSVFS